VGWIQWAFIFTWWYRHNLSCNNNNYDDTTTTTTTTTNNNNNNNNREIGVKLDNEHRYNRIWHSEDRALWHSLIIKPTRCTNFSNLFLEQSSTCFGPFLCPSPWVYYSTHSNTYRFADSLRAGSGRNCSSVLILLASCQQNFMAYTIAMCTVKNSWWCTDELSETLFIKTN